ncbi:MAG TPA: IPT/TIG domain-containing protein [Thermoanaerobaculia bacterium]
MKHLILLFTILFSTALFAQTPTVSTIQPASGPSSGGTEVTILGTNLLTKVQCIVPCPALVTFGNITVPVKSETDTRLIVDTPPHAPGLVDVSVTVAAEQPVKITNGFMFTSDHDDTYEQVLLPVYLDGTINGAFGSVWKTDFRLRNDSDEAIQLAPWPCPPDLVCPPVYPLTKFLAGGESIHNLDPFFKAPNGNPRRLLYVSKPGVSMNLRFADISRSTLNAGTDLPLVRENAMRTSATQLFNVPMTSGFRVLLRVYEMAYTSAGFTVRLYDQSNLTATASPVHVLTLNATTSQTNDFRTEAAYTEFDITGLLALEKVWPAAVRIEITPDRPGSRYWAFASITNNATQLVTLSTPQ